ncbi:hypothetical protein [Oceanicola sp. 22II-s10i]|uniref:hypothetical protein n=1 Tax=Oceanicola sp. 22II-s10i TaxID=1317116 RepID=UPI000B524878|nr:hypothetical protein [Oceanicola sp. 22II-s10i]
MLIMAVALEGHAFTGVPPLTQAGVLLMANLVPPRIAGRCRVAMEQVPAPWMCIILLALELRPN